MTTRTYVDAQGYDCFEHTNSVGDKAVVKSKGNCLEITPSHGCRLKFNTDGDGRVIFVWMVTESGGG